MLFIWCPIKAQAFRHAPLASANWKLPLRLTFRLRGNALDPAPYSRTPIIAMASNTSVTTHEIVQRIPGYVITTIVKIVPTAGDTVPALPSPPAGAPVNHDAAEPAPPTAAPVNENSIPGAIKDTNDSVADDLNWNDLPQQPVLPPPPPPTEGYSSRIPHPSELQLRPGMERHQGKFYTIFRGREVGIFYDPITEVQPRVNGVPNCFSKGYKTWEEAVSEYARAYGGLKPGYELAAINPPSVAYPLPGEIWGNGVIASGSGAIVVSDSSEDDESSNE
ncbi:hypothetical protein VNI00_015852 [Paramarasmius palmivorus]|uniref:Ribonuclease H1 N-terminal domain-containing protein n=1 Tax=Paramarasmius palmivorus TaxID=297713 RepID=A0AAW0BI54_9AGAR